MKVGIIGGSITGILTAILIKQRNKNIDVTILEKNDKLCKKIYATGNGKCNIFTNRFSEQAFRNDFLNLNENTYNIIQKMYEGLGFAFVNEEGLYYPYSKSARTFVGSLIRLAENLNIKMLTNIEISEFIFNNKEIILKSNDLNFQFDIAAITTGGKSSPNFGSTGEMFDILKKHNIEFSKINPGLCPVKIKESTKSIEGLRIKTKLKLFHFNNDLMYEEEGEVLFKKDGISGICVMNAASIIARHDIFNKYIFTLDLLPLIDKDNFLKTIKNSVLEEPLNAFFESKLAHFIKDYYGILDITSLNENSLCKLYFNLKQFKLTYKGLYDFKNSQVSVGGVKLKEIDDCFNLKKLPNVFLGGEILDQDGLCGGFNLMWCAFCSIKISERILNKYEE